MNERVERLREESIRAVPAVSGERARLLTAFHRSEELERHSVPVRRALAFRYLLDRQTIHVGDDELIVGERGPAPKATPTYPELCCHTLEDLDVLPVRGRTPFAVDVETRTLYAESVIPFWEGQSLRDRVFATMSAPWRAAFDAGVFTEFMGAACAGARGPRQQDLPVRNRRPCRGNRGVARTDRDVERSGEDGQA